MNFEKEPQHIPETERKEEMGVSEAMAEVQNIMQQEMAKGAVDSEREDFQSILERLAAEQISPKEAVIEAHMISNSRQDYH